MLQVSLCADVRPTRDQVVAPAHLRFAQPSRVASFEPAPFVGGLAAGVGIVPGSLRFGSPFAGALGTLSVTCRRSPTQDRLSGPKWRKMMDGLRKQVSRP